MNTSDPRGPLRWHVYSILIVVSAGIMLGRIFAVDSVDMFGLQKYRFDQIPKLQADKRKELEQAKPPIARDEIDRVLAERQEKLERDATLRRMFLSANDRSRWCTVRALVEPEMQVDRAFVDGREVEIALPPYAIDRVIQERGWDTIDMVKHDGHLYSSKPPILATLMAGEYWLIVKLTGETLGTQPYAIGRFMLATINIPPLLLMFWLLAKLLERFCNTDWSRVFVMAAAALGTYLTTFAVVINNHAPAAVSASIALYAAIRIWFDGERRERYFLLAGFFGAFAVANELPALALLAALGAALLWRAPRQTLAAFVPAMLVVAAAYFGTNWIAHQSLRPAYMHRSPADAEGNLIHPEDDWYRFTYNRDSWETRKDLKAKGKEPRQIESYWTNPTGIDAGEPSPAAYALHCLVGHHGIFSLTPIWVLTIIGLGLWLRPGEERQLRELALLIAAISLAVIAFYLTRPQVDRNYGGTTTGLRWVFWLAPLWLIGMIPALDAAAANRWLRRATALALAVSILSACYATWNPWTHPWFYDWMAYAGWL